MAQTPYKSAVKETVLPGALGNVPVKKRPVVKKKAEAEPSEPKPKSPRSEGFGDGADQGQSPGVIHNHYYNMSGGGNVIHGDVSGTVHGGGGGGVSVVGDVKNSNVAGRDINFGKKGGRAGTGGDTGGAGGPGAGGRTAGGPPTEVSRPVGSPELADLVDKARKRKTTPVTPDRPAIGAGPSGGGAGGGGGGGPKPVAPSSSSAPGAKAEPGARGLPAGHPGGTGASGGATPGVASSETPSGRKGHFDHGQRSSQPEFIDLGEGEIVSHGPGHQPSSGAKDEDIHEAELVEDKALPAGKAAAPKPAIAAPPTGLATSKRGFTRVGEGQTTSATRPPPAAAGKGLAVAGRGGFNVVGEGKSTTTSRPAKPKKTPLALPAGPTKAAPVTAPAKAAPAAAPTPAVAAAKPKTTGREKLTAARQKIQAAGKTVGKVIAGPEATGGEAPVEGAGGSWPGKRPKNRTEQVENISQANAVPKGRTAAAIRLAASFPKAAAPSTRPGMEPAGENVRQMPSVTVAPAQGKQSHLSSIQLPPHLTKMPHHTASKMTHNNSRAHIEGNVESGHTVEHEGQHYTVNKPVKNQPGVYTVKKSEGE